MSEPRTAERHEDEISVSEARQWIEFGAWSSSGMTPIIWALQGPSVSTDQLVVRTALLVISLFVAIGMRIWAIVQPISQTGQTGKPTKSDAHD